MLSLVLCRGLPPLLRAWTSIMEGHGASSTSQWQPGMERERDAQSCAAWLRNKLSGDDGWSARTIASLLRYRTVPHLSMKQRLSDAIFVMLLTYCAGCPAEATHYWCSAETLKNIQVCFKLLDTSIKVKVTNITTALCSDLPRSYLLFSQ